MSLYFNILNDRFLSEETPSDEPFSDKDEPVDGYPANEPPPATRSFSEFWKGISAYANPKTPEN